MVDTCDLKSHASFRIPVQVRSEVVILLQKDYKKKVFYL
jgi:hypothetical protein